MRLHVAASIDNQKLVYACIQHTVEQGVVIYFADRFARSPATTTATGLTLPLSIS